MEHEPTSDFTDRVMDKIEHGSNVSHGEFGKKKKLYILLGIAASVLVVAFGLSLGSQSSDNSAGSQRNVAINTRPNTTTATTTPGTNNSEANAVADEIDDALTSFDKDLSSDISSNTLDSSNLNDNGI
ncbi:MAG TPA: hypothetical protein PKB15_01640 [Acidimicrobiia bacterium]|nr:hypothetical protein [Acidimicrobiia bacterium]